MIVAFGVPTYKVSPTPGPGGLWPVAVLQGRIAAEALLAAPAPAGITGTSGTSGATGATGADSAPIVLQLKSEGIDLRSFGDIETVPPGAEVLTADPADLAWWRLVVLPNGRIAAAVYVGPPGTAQELTRAIQSNADLTPNLPALRQRRLVLEVEAVGA